MINALPHECSEVITKATPSGTELITGSQPSVRPARLLKLKSEVDDVISCTRSADRFTRCVLTSFTEPWVHVTRSLSQLAAASEGSKCAEVTRGQALLKASADRETEIAERLSAREEWVT